ncbi:MAG: hypothetical protein JNL67_17670 [Planctomycetaceae bacterium]|nr:hypothetical protein [Planctomycetaceae bacterium]
MRDPSPPQVLQQPGLVDDLPEMIGAGTCVDCGTYAGRADGFVTGAIAVGATSTAFDTGTPADGSSCVGSPQ